MLDHQLSALEGMRSRAISLLAGTTAASAFLGGTVFNSSDPPDLWGLLVPGVAYLFVLGLCLYIVGAREWTSSLKVPVILSEYYQKRPLVDAHRYLAENMQRIFDKQDKTLKKLGRALRWESFATLATLLAWTWVVANEWG